jgi:putative addiction module component (TIGR02574 family)
MGEASRKILQQALALPEDERVTLATELLASLDGEPDRGWDDLWLAELERRSRAAEQRGTPAPEWSEVRARILAGLGAH